MYIKPEIKLPLLPLINIWLQNDYNNLHGEEEVIEFVFKKLDEIETTKNPVRLAALKGIAYPLYQIITNKSYQSKI